MFLFQFYFLVFYFSLTSFYTKIYQKYIIDNILYINKYKRIDLNAKPLTNKRLQNWAV